VGQNSEKLADLLMEKALTGDLAYAKALLGLADSKKPEPVKRRGLSLAQRLMAGPEWQRPAEGNEDTSYRILRPAD
jgi:hypothetical protein